MDKAHDGSDGYRPTGRRLRVLSEETVKREGVSEDIENPYWSWEELPEHPNPELGCVRRGLCCKSSPGWFGPGEVEKAAALLGMEPDAFVRRYIVVDRIEVDGEPVDVFVPVKLDRFGEPLVPPATRVDALYRMFRGPCIFYDGEGCGIYAARPVECVRYICTNQPAENLSHDAIARMWQRGEARDDV